MTAVKWMAGLVLVGLVLMGGMTASMVAKNVYQAVLFAHRMRLLYEFEEAKKAEHATLKPPSEAVK